MLFDIISVSSSATVSLSRVVSVLSSAKSGVRGGAVTSSLATFFIPEVEDRIVSLSPRAINIAIRPSIVSIPNLSVTVFVRVMYRSYLCDCCLLY